MGHASEVHTRQSLTPTHAHSHSHYLSLLPTPQAITTMSTVGYGDIVPHTGLGKLIAGVTMIAGLLVLSLPMTGEGEWMGGSVCCY